MIPPSIPSLYQYIFRSTVYWSFSTPSAAHGEDLTRSGDWEEHVWNRCCMKGSWWQPCCPGPGGLQCSSVRVSHGMLSLGGTQTCCWVSFCSPAWWSFWLQLLFLWQQRFLSHCYRFIPDMFSLGVKIEYWHRSQFLLAPALLKLGSIYSRGLASTEQSIKHSTLWSAINNSCSYFLLSLYRTIFLSKNLGWILKLLTEELLAFNFTTNPIMQSVPECYLLWNIWSCVSQRVSWNSCSIVQREQISLHSCLLTISNYIHFSEMNINGSSVFNKVCSWFLFPLQINFSFHFINLKRFYFM